MFKHPRIRHKLLISYSIVFILSISLGSTFIYLLVRNTIKRNIQSELNNATNAILNTVSTSAAVSIKNYLRAVAEKNLELVQYLHRQTTRGILTEAQARQQAAALMLSQTIGESGYIYCMNSKGMVTVHPQAALINTNVSDFQFVREQLKLKKEYIEYDWRNPGETRARPKALFMVYFEPWDWIISVSSYRREFKNLVNVDDFRKAVLGVDLGPSGYAFVIDGRGRAVIHPKLEGTDLPVQFLEEMQRSPSGQILYPWKNPGETAARMKMVIYHHLPDYDWIVASSIYLDECYRPLSTIRHLIMATVLITLALVLPITSRISASITDPLQKLMDRFSQVVSGDFTHRMPATAADEIGQLYGYFNRFMGQLERYHGELNKEIQVRRKTEEDLRQSEARYRSVMEAAPDPIVTYDMQGRVTYMNPAFTRVFGWGLAECLDRRLDHFVPEENWEETRAMIQTIIDGGRLDGTQTRRYNKAGAIVQVSISGATFRDGSGQLAGSVIILRDITNAERLRKQVMDIAEGERQKFGQVLHDDLCPHLIGIQGLSTVLHSNLAEAASGHEPLAGQIVMLMGQAIDKARGLARDLCPVHMVAHGLETALADLSARTTSVSGIPCRFVCDPPVVLKDRTAAVHLFYIAQEAVNNAVKHSGARTITVTLDQTGEKIRLRIGDDGGGMPAQPPAAGIGLQIMQYRAKIIGAGFDLKSSDQGGTTVQVVVAAHP